MSFTPFTRRRFLQGASAVMAASPWMLSDGRVSAAEGGLNGRLYKTLKVGMAGGVQGSLTDKFKAAKAAGFLGIEMNAPGMDVAETKKAIADSGLVVDGTVCSSHWKVCHTSPDPGTRAQALKDLESAIRDTHAVGGNTVLLVVGVGRDGPEDEIWPRSVENISKALLPLASELGVYIAIENVWNEMLYDPQGDATQSAEKFVRYVDDFNSPWVGMQFDIGNHWKFGNTGDWIRDLGQRVVKLDLKGFSRAQDKFVDIGEGDIDWADVRAALGEIGYTGWAAAEVRGGDEQRLRLVSSQMDRVFGLTG